jgi:ubiquinone/menaquinone biosynthesis C-methylase UbiE
MIGHTWCFSECFGQALKRGIINQEHSLIEENFMSVSFDRAVEYYDQTRGFPPGVEVHAGAAIAKAGGFTGSEQVLEIGVGTGRIALPVAPHVQRYFGIDISTQMMNRLLSKRTNEQISLTQGSATQLPFPDAGFDAAVAVHIFHLIPDWQQALTELRRVLKPDGRLIHCWNDDDQAWDIESLFKQLFPEGESAVQVERPGAKGKTFLEDSGWHMGIEETYSYTVERTPAIALDMLRGRKWSRTWQMSDEQIAAASEGLEQALKQKFADIHQPVSVTTTFHARVYTPPR